MDFLKILFNKEKIGQKAEVIMKTKIIYFIVVLIAILIVFQLFNVAFIQKSKWQKALHEKAFKYSIDEARRGNIYDISGKLLATSVPFYTISIDLGLPKMTDSIFNANVDSLAFLLGKFQENRNRNTTKTEEWYRNRLKTSRKKKRNRYVRLINSVNFEEKEQIRKFPLLRLPSLRGGFISEVTYRRQKPFGDLLRKTLGKVKYNDVTKKNEVFKGVEIAYNKVLSGRIGKSLKKRIAKGYYMQLPNSIKIPSVDGNDIVMAVDINLQNFTDSVLRKQLKRFDAAYGLAVVMEVKTGDIKAIVNLKKGIDSIYHENMNYAVGQKNAPGSTFKVVAMLAAMEDGTVKLTDTIDTGNGFYQNFNTPIYDSEGGYGKIPYWKVIVKSSNVGMAKMVRQKYYDTNKREYFIERLKSMGFGGVSGIDLKNETHPYIKTVDGEDWAKSTLMMMAHGYEIEVTPLQILTFYNAIANNGELKRPRLVKYIKKNGKLIENDKYKDENRTICTVENAKLIQEVLKKVVTEGTAKRLSHKKYKIAGKTGTAEEYDFKLQKYDEFYRASFVGYFPADNPKYSCIVVAGDIASKDKQQHHGGNVAAPVFGQIADKIYSQDVELNQRPKPDLNGFAFLQVPESKSGYRQDSETIFSILGIETNFDKKVNFKSDWVSTKKQAHSVTYKNRKVKKLTVPNVYEMGAKDAIYALESVGLDVTVIGRGTVREQSLKAGLKFNKGKPITIILK